MTDTATMRNRRGRLRWRGAVAALALGVFAVPPCVRLAQAADAFQTASKAMLVFGPTAVGPEQVTQLCVWNKSDQDAAVVFSVYDLGSGLFAGGGPPDLVQAHRSVCKSGSFQTDKFGASIEFEFPTQCTQAKEYPGACWLFGSLEISNSSDPYASRLRVEPVFVPASPGLKLPPIAPQ